MSLINVTNIKIGNNVCNIRLPIKFQIEFECLENLKNDVEWKIIYITSDGSNYITKPTPLKENTELNTETTTQTNGVSKDDNTEEAKDQNGVQNPEVRLEPEERNGEIVLDSVYLGPIYKGVLEFEFVVSPPNFNNLNPDCILGMQAILISGNYNEQEFIRIGYYTNNTYDDETLRENPPDVPNLSKIVRCIIDQPRVTRFPIVWDNNSLVDHEGNNLSFFSYTSAERCDDEGEEGDVEDNEEEEEDDEDGDGEESYSGESFTGESSNEVDELDNTGETYSAESYSGGSYNDEEPDNSGESLKNGGTYNPEEMDNNDNPDHADKADLDNELNAKKRRLL